MSHEYMNPEELAAIRERADKATPGPWKVYTKSKGRLVERLIGTSWEHPQIRGPRPIVTLQIGKEDVTVYISEDDSTFIAHAREDVPRLLDALEAAYERERVLVEMVRWYGPEVAHDRLKELGIRKGE